MLPQRLEPLAQLGPVALVVGLVGWAAVGVVSEVLVQLVQVQPVVGGCG